MQQDTGKQPKGGMLAKLLLVTKQQVNKGKP